MEEILASIRRIIEDSDSGRKPDDADELRQDLEPAPAGKAVPDVDAFRAEFRAEPEVKKPVTLAEVQAQLSSGQPAIARMEAPVRHEPHSPRPPMTLAEVGALVAAEPDRTVEADAPAMAKTPEAAEAIVTDWRREIAAVGEPAKSTAMVETDKAGSRRTLDARSEVELFEDELTSEPAFEPPSAPSGSARPAAVEDAPSRPAILSEHAGRQVAAAFGELSDAFASRGKKTFDEMAEEMLRPMLRDWLDNNLPTLVERLVREEIERVARGAQ